MTARKPVRRRAGRELSREARAARALAAVAGSLLAMAAVGVAPSVLPGPVARELASVAQETASSCSVEGGQGLGGASSAAPEDVDGSPAGALAKGSLSEGALGAVLEGTARQAAANAALPEGFAEELFDVRGLEDPRVSDSGDVVGFLSRDGADEAFSALKGRLEANGWTFVESGIENAGSFAKPDGSHRACFLSCTEVAGMTAVVVQCPRSDARP